MSVKKADDDIQHGIDDNPDNDAEKGAVLGGAGGAAIGAAAGSMTGPAGAVIGGVVGGLAGAGGSGAAVGAVDKADNDNNVTGIGDGVAPDLDEKARNGVRNAEDGSPGNEVPGVQTGGHDADGSPDTRGIMEKISDAVTGDRIDDKTGKRV